MSLPLPKDQLPAKVQRFGAPDAPAPAKHMAARGLVPVKGEDLVALLVQLAHDADAGVREAATKTLEGLPDGVLATACSAELHAELLEGLVPHVRERPALLGDLVANRQLPVEAVAEVARWADERTCERIATDQERLLGAPAIIEGLYKNKNTRMSTVDRLVELAARNGVVLHNVATFEAHVEAIQDQLIVDEPTEEPLPTDRIFAESLALDGDEDAVEQDKVDGSEEVKDNHRPLAMRISDMSIGEKIRLSLLGNASARSILVRDANKTVAMAAVSSPAMTDAEAARVAVSKQISEDVLRYIGNRREWHSNYEVKRSLVFNAKTPIGISMKFLSHMRANDLRGLARSKGVPASLRTAAKQRLSKKSRG